ncbi:MAG: hypothetical protein JO036_05980 [Candidatus Eremiobacteraeota bacterium]|nr:hypothetical protein [Candidatus Eremiobacteraeota bacterium]
MMQLLLAVALVAFASAGPVRPTRVTTYVPVVPAGRAVTGTCWTRSIAAPNRSDAYRCMVRNSIYDPCFVPPQGSVAVCDVDPASNRRGFAIRLTKPLPQEPVFQGAPQPWLVELTDGNVCIPLTGTHAQLNGRTILYECSESRERRNRGQSTGLIAGSITPGRVWHAGLAVYDVDNRAGEPSGTITSVPLAAVWR